MNLIIFDIETTGFSPNYHEIIQIAALSRSGQVIGMLPSGSIPLCDHNSGCRG
jgi:oligoribonuclease (3'-5' exoribonuclease)